MLEKKKRKTIFEARIRIEKWSKLSEILAPTLIRNLKQIEKRRKMRKSDFQNSKQNRQVQSKQSEIIAATLNLRFF